MLCFLFLSSYLKARVQSPYKAAHGSEDEAAFAENNNPAGVADLSRGNSPHHDADGKTLSQMYLLAYGVPLLICCVSAAVHVKEYGGPDVCALSIRPSVWAVFVPVGFTVVVLWVISMATWCTLKCRMAPTSPHPVDGDGLFEPSNEDHLPQLYSHLLVFVLFALTVVFGALATAHDVSTDDAFDNDEDASKITHDPVRVTWAVLYALSSFALGIFALIRFAFQKVDFGVVFPLETNGTKPGFGTHAVQQPLLGPVAPQVSSTTAVTGLGMVAQQQVHPGSSIVASTDDPGHVGVLNNVNGSLSSSRTAAVPPGALVGPHQPGVVTRSMVSGDGFVVAPIAASQMGGQQMPVAIPSGACRVMISTCSTQQLLLSFHAISDWYLPSSYQDF